MKKMTVFLATVCLAVLGLSAHAGEGYVLNMYHFNMQYVAGSDKAAAEGTKKGLEPLLDLYLKHPDWKADFEMQAQYLDYMAANFPQVLDKLKKLAKNGQAEMVSFHYSDQLLLAFPRLDEERSLQLTKEIFSKHGIPLSGVIFTQEAQMGEGLCALGKKWGYSIAVMTAGPYNWFQDDPGLPYFDCRGLALLKAENPDIPPEQEKIEDVNGVKVKWYFLGDGELVVTGGISPYFGALFQANKGRIKKVEDDFAKLQQEGYKIATISEYVDALRRSKIEPRPMKPILDAPWRPEDDSGVFTWMGKYVMPGEDDWGIRTQNWQTRSWLVAAEKAGISWDQLRESWKNQLDAEVSDSTGWYPLPVELRYSPEKSRMVVDAVKKLCPACQPGELKLELEKIAPKALPVAAEVTGAQKSELKFFSVKDRAGLFAVEAKIKAGADTSLTFPLRGNELVYSPALLEDQVARIPLDRIKPSDFYVGAPNGLAGLGQDLWLIRDNQAGTVALGMDMVNKQIHFRVQKASGKEIFYRVYIFKGSEKDALEFANALNQTGQ